MLDFLIPIAVRMVELTMLVLLPVAVQAAGRPVLRRLGLPDLGPRIPGLVHFSVASGAITGFLLLFLNSHPADFHPATLLADGGPWETSLGAMAGEWLDPARYDPRMLWGHLTGFNLADPVTLFLGLAALLGAVVVLAALRHAGTEAPRALLVAGLLWLWAAAMAVYMVCAVAWALHALHLWAFPLALLAYRGYGLRRPMARGSLR
ncbi:hypothetical protein [Azospirillum soli]|uniref:hypothetical protein n=1 Tax=Azospirillum soli TaxID=1304799 RepID=UPI001AE4DFF5|nr:hypothetical protein [Azospirillum soli]MBP2314116.1 hypothetical protein [Azospirillum soli]